MTNTIPTLGDGFNSGTFANKNSSKFSGTIYIAVNKITGKIYVGQTSGYVSRRIRGHKEYALYSKKASQPFPSSIRKHGWDAFYFQIIEENIDTPDKLDLKEVYWIKELCTLAPNGYNATLGGQSGKNLTSEIKKKISSTKTGVKLGPCTKEHRDAISKAKLESGYKHSAETIANIKIGRAHHTKLSEKHIQHLREAAQQNKQWKLSLQEENQIKDLVNSKLFTLKEIGEFYRVSIDTVRRAKNRNRSK